MANLCREAAYGPVREAASSIQHISANEVSKYSSTAELKIERVAPLTLGPVVAIVSLYSNSRYTEFL